MKRYTREDPHPLAVAATEQPDLFEEVAEERTGEDTYFRPYRHGYLVTDKPEWGWGIVVWLYEDYTGDVEIVGPYSRIQRMRHIVKNELPAYWAEIEAQHKAEIDAEYGWLRAAEMGTPADWAEEDYERQREAFFS